MLAFLFLLFPTGRLHSRRWRPAAWFVGAVFAATAVEMIVRATRVWQDPFGSFTEAETPVELTALLVVATAIPSFLTTWVVAGVLSNLAFLCLWVAIGIAVLKYRLYDIDIVISKAVLYGSLAVFITAVYAGLVVGVGALAGNRRSPLLAALAAAVVAVAFQPARQRAGRLANRVVYGRRATPYQVLSQFAQRIGGAYAHEDVLPQMAHIVADGTGAEHGRAAPPGGQATRRGRGVAGRPGPVERRADRGPPGVAAAYRHRAG
jgi:hypothetical protein